LLRPGGPHQQHARSIRCGLHPSARRHPGISAARCARTSRPVAGASRGRPRARRRRHRCPRGGTRSRGRTHPPRGPGPRPPRPRERAADCARRSVARRRRRISQAGPPDPARLGRTAMTTGNGYDLDQSLIVAPDVGFGAVAAAVEATGLRPEARGAGPPLIAGEPELASWSRGGGKPFVTYTLNPVAMLRVLDVATAPPPLRADLASRLKLLARDEVASLLDASETRDVLRGLWAARETQRTDPTPRVQ